MIMELSEVERLEKIGQGKCADIYRKDKEAYKILKDNSDSRKFYSKEMLQKLVGIKTELCVFPNDIIEDKDGKLLGYSMDYIKGNKFYDVFKKIPLEKLIQELKVAENDIKEIADKKVIFEDMHFDNIMWNEEKNTIQIIDTDFFDKSEGLSYDEIYSANSRKFAQSITDMLGLKIFEYTQNNENMKEFYDAWHLKYRNNESVSIQEYLINLNKVMEEDFGSKFNSISEMEEALNKRAQELEDLEYERMQQKNKTVKQKVVEKIISIGKKLLNSGAKATEENTRTSTINEQVRNIENIQKERTKTKNKSNDEISK